MRPDHAVDRGVALTRTTRAIPDDILADTDQRAEDAGQTIGEHWQVVRDRALGISKRVNRIVSFLTGVDLLPRRPSPEITLGAE